jgi:hypothetical protein
VDDTLYEIDDITRLNYALVVGEFQYLVDEFRSSSTPHSTASTFSDSESNESADSAMYRVECLSDFSDSSTCTSTSVYSDYCPAYELLLERIMTEKESTVTGPCPEPLREFCPWFPVFEERVFQHSDSEFLDSMDMSLCNYADTCDTDVVKSAVTVGRPLDTCLTTVDDYTSLVLDPIPEDDDEDTPEDDDVQAPTADSDLFYELTEQLYCDIWANQSRDEYAERLARRDEDYDSTPSSENVSTRTDVDNFHLSDVSPQSLSILTDSLSHLPPTASAIIADVVEGLVCLRIQLSFASTAPQIIAALSCFLRRFTTGSVSLSLLQQVPDLGTKLADVLTDVQPQSGSADSVLGALDFISRSVTTLESHPIVTKVRYLAFCALSYKLLAPFGLTLESESFQSLVVAHRNRPVRATDFIVSLTDSAYWLISTGWQVLQTGIVSTFYHSSASYTQIYERGVALDLRLNAIKGQTFEEGDVTRLIADLEAHVSELEECKVLAERTGIREAHALRANWREWLLKL